jgi:hypothetical protein
MTDKDYPTPILDGLIEAGHIRVVAEMYIGTASDGTEVSIGSTYPFDGKPGKAYAEAYLNDYPTPESW